MPSGTMLGDLNLTIELNYLEIQHHNSVETIFLKGQA